jgi:hypothetical protein
MFEQSGVDNISFSGISYDVDNNQKPNIKITSKLVNRKAHFEYEVEFLIYGLEDIELLKDNTGATVTYYNGNTTPIDRQLNYSPDTLDTTKTNTIVVKMKTERPKKYGTT